MFDISNLYDADTEDQADDDIRSSKLTNRSIYTIKKVMLRKEALEVTPD